MNNNVSTYRVMIVDDEAILRTGIIHLCNWSKYGIEIVSQVSNGQEALDHIESTRPHVVITDIVMPVMDGIEFSKIMKVKYPEIKIIVLSSYSEYDYVREVFKYGVTDYLLKPKVSSAELITLIQTLCGSVNLHTSGNIRPNLDISLILAQWLEHDSLPNEESIDLLTKYFRGNCFMLAKASNSLLLSRTEWSQNQMEELLLSLAKQHLSNNLTYSFIFLKTEFLILLNYEETAAQNITTSIQSLAEAVKDKLLYISFILSNPFSGLEQIKEAHLRLTPYLGKLIYFPTQVVVSENAILIPSEKVSFDLNQFTSLLRILAIDDAREQLKAFFLKILSTQDYDEYSLKRLCQNLIYTAMSTLEHIKQPISELGSSRLKLFKTIDLAYSINELESILIQFLDALKSSMKQTDQQSMILHQIYEYVNKHYANEISLSEMANTLHLNYSYLSSYFKQRTQENLTTYISRVRIDKAKELLLDPNLSVSEISRLTGFSEHNYFSKVFKKMTGKTPVEFRTQISQ